MSQIFEHPINGKNITIETGRFAEQANGAVAVSYGDTTVLVTVCADKEPREETDFFPLIVDYEERLYAAGKIPGGFIRREGRPSQEATLASRLTDRSIRPLFPSGFRNGVQVVITVLSTDQENDPDILAIIGASSALSISDIPFNGPVGATRIGCINGELVLNPTFTQLQSSVLDVVIVSTKQAVIMVEGGAHEVSEDLVLEAIDLGHKANQETIDLQEHIITECSKPKMEFEASVIPSEVEEAISRILGDRLSDIITRKEKIERSEALSELSEEVLEKLGATYPTHDILSAFDSKIKTTLRSAILRDGIRPGGRQTTEIRPISCDVGLLPRTHGSGLFSRGQTQVLSITTLGSLRQVQILDGLTQEESKRFMHHYNFPPFSVGEVRRIGATGRREIGHGALVERSLLPVLPEQEDFPYTIRLVSEVLSSNGSSSMASVCGSSLALMDAGVPIKTAVAGVALGLITGDSNEYVLLTDIEGMEDHYGDMDFKVAGTAAGITGLQLDIKIQGVASSVLGDALNRARDARLFILDKMQQAIKHSRPELSPYAPRMTKVTIDPAKIGSVIGPGGKTIRSIIEQTKTTIDVQDDGTIYIGSTDKEGAQKAVKAIGELTREVEIGGIYTGKVTRIVDFGAFVEILPGKEGLVHISELADYRVPSVVDVVMVGDEITVVVTNIDSLGRINLSRRAILNESSQESRERGSETGSALPRNHPRRSHPGVSPNQRQNGKKEGDRPYHSTGSSRPNSYRALRSLPRHPRDKR